MYTKLDLLFSGYDVHSTAETYKEDLKIAVRKIPSADFVASDIDLTAKVVSAYDLNVPVLGEDIEASEEDVQVDVSHDVRRMRWNKDGKPIHVLGKRIAIHVPYHGNKGFFFVRPSTFSLNPPLAQVDSQELRLVYEIPNDMPIDVTAAYKKSISEINTNLGFLRSSISNLAQQLEALALNQVQQRSVALVNSLGLPIRRSDEGRKIAPAVRQAVPQPAASDNLSYWDAFLSHASEDKDDIARDLAAILEKAGFRIWFDEFTLNIGDSLRRSIDRGLASSRYGIVILSTSFFAKHWTNIELDGLATREIGGGKVILPVWHNVDLNEVRQYSPTLADRVAAKTSLGLANVAAQISSVLRKH